MTWNPDLSDTDEVRRSGNILSQALELLNTSSYSRMSDSFGTFAYDTEQGILVAKSYIYGNIVSAHKRAVIQAHEKAKPLLMFIASVNKIYSFDPVRVIQNSEENRRGASVMLNWNIRLGRLYKDASS